MRLLILLLLGCLPIALAAEPSTVYIDAESRILAPNGGVHQAPDVETLDSARFSLTTDACHAELRIDVSWDPASHEVVVGGRGAALDTVVHAKLVDDEGTLLAEKTRAGGVLFLTYTATADQSVDLVLTADVGVDLRAHALVMGWVPAAAPPCSE